MSFVPMPPYPWFDKVWQNFVTRTQTNTIAHALLLSGPDGLGAMALARAFTQLLLCKSPLDGVACNRCRSCQLLGSSTHPDMLVVEPEAPAKQIKIEQVRAITRFIANTAQQGGRKIIIMSPVDALNHNAANALLKSLEEPAGDTVLILLTSKESQLLATIKSRCARVVLSPPDHIAGSRWLGEQGYTEHVNLLSESGNAPLKVIEWVTDGYYEQRNKIRTCLLNITHRHVGPVQSAVALKGVEPPILLDLIMSQIDDIIRLKMASNSEKSQEILKALDQTAREIFEYTKRITNVTLMRYRERLCEQKKELFLNNNLNAQLITEQLLMDWSAITSAR